MKRVEYIKNILNSKNTNEKVMIACYANGKIHYFVYGWKDELGKFWYQCNGHLSDKMIYEPTLNLNEALEQLAKISERCVNNFLKGHLII